MSDEARAEQLVEAMARAMCGDGVCGMHLADARAALNVVRTERGESKPCATCGGQRLTLTTEQHGWVPCPTCNGSGSVPGELLVVGLIGALTEEYDHAVEAWEYAAERADEGDEAVGLLRGIVERHDRSDYPMDLTDEVKGARSFLARIIERDAP